MTTILAAKLRTETTKAARTLTGTKVHAFYGGRLFVCGAKAASVIDPAAKVSEAGICRKCYSQHQIDQAKD